MKMYYFVIVKLVLVLCRKSINLRFFLFIHEKVMLAEGFDTV